MVTKCSRFRSALAFQAVVYLKLDAAILGGDIFLALKLMAADFFGQFPNPTIDTVRFLTREDPSM